MRRSPIRSAGLIALPLMGLFLLAAGGAGSAPGLGLRAVAPEPTADRQVATFAGGCFWSMQKAFDGVNGVVSTTVGYSGGRKADPTYEDVEKGKTGHAESVQLFYDPTKISYEQLLDIYWHHIDPLTEDAAFCDHGSQYRSIIFYRDGEQRRLAEASKQALDQSHRFRTPIVTEILLASAFYPAEEYHQMYYKKNPARYEAYRAGCGRDARLKQLWGESSDASHQSPAGKQESGAR